MKLGVIRKFDKNGRVQIPVEIRDMLGVSEDTQVNVYIDEGKVIISPINSGGVIE